MKIPELGLIQIFFLSAFLPQTWWNTICEDSTHSFISRTSKYKAGTELEASSLLVSFFIITQVAMHTAGEEKSSIVSLSGEPWILQSCSACQSTPAGSMVTTDLIQITKDFWLYLRPLPWEIIHVWEGKPDRWELQGPSWASVANTLLKFCYTAVSNWPLCIISNLRHCSFQLCQKASPSQFSEKNDCWVLMSKCEPDVQRLWEY